MGKRFFLAAALASLLVAMGCLERMCERHGYYPPAAAPAQCCVPCVCQPAPAAGYVAPAASWNAPVASAGTCPPGCVPAGH
jgi:hypothetical protein